MLYPTQSYFVDISCSTLNKVILWTPYALPQTKLFCGHLMLYHKQNSFVDISCSIPEQNHFMDTSCSTLNKIIFETFNPHPKQNDYHVSFHLFLEH